MRTTKLIFSIIIGLCVTTSAFAQSNENQLFYASKATVKADKIEQYIGLSKKWAEACEEHNYEFSFTVWQSNIYDFYWFYPVDDYNAVKDITAKSWELVPKLDEGFVKEYLENIEFSEDFFIHYIDSLSYTPETPVEGLVYAEWRISYNKPYSGMKFRKAFKHAVDMREQLNSEYPSGSLYGDIGMNGGECYIKVFWGKNPADLHTTQSETWNSFGEEVHQVIRDLQPSRRKFEVIPFWFQKEMSYSPE